MAISASYYGTIDEANDYFALRLHETAWTNAATLDRPKALIAATQTIDGLNYKGFKRSVWQLLQSYNLDDLPTANPPDPGHLIVLPTTTQILEADASQELEFPRGNDTDVPEAIRRACYEIAYSLLDGKDPELELENLGVSSQGYASVRTTYSRTHVPVEHLVNMVPSATAWRLLVPFLRDANSIRLSRVS